MGSKQCKPVIEYERAKSLLPPHELLILMAMFQRLSTDRTLSGVISNDKFIRNVLLPECSDFSETIVRRLVDVIDTNGNGSVEWPEFVSAMYVFTRGMEDEKFKLVFNMFDLNANRRVSKKDFGTIAVEILKHGNSNTTPDNIDVLKQLLVQTVMLEYDRLRDGSLTYSEWRRYAMEDDRISALVGTFGQIKAKRFDIETAALLKERKKSISTGKI